MKKHIILPITLAAMMILGGCAKSSQPANTNTGSDTASTDTGDGGGATTDTGTTDTGTTDTGTTDTGSETVVNSVSITNKEALAAEWTLNEATRKVQVSADPAIEDINDLLDEGTLVVTSSDPTVVSVTRLLLSAKAEGSATITVTYGGKSDSVVVTISAEKTAKDLYGTVHEGTAEDPFDNADAVKAAPLASAASDTTKYYVKGIVKSFYHAVGSRTDGLVSWYIEDAEGKAGFECYKISKESGSITDDDIWIGAEVVVKGVLTVYNGQAETDTGIWVENTGKGAAKPQPKQDITASVEEALALASSMENGDSTYDNYHVTGYITEIKAAYDASYGNLSFNIATEKGGATVLYVYRCKASATDAEKLLVGAQVKVAGSLKKYNDAMQLDAGCSLEEILAEADPADVPADPVEPTVVTTPVAGTEYLAGVYQSTNKKQTFLTGVKSGNYLSVTEAKAEAATVVFEAVDGGYNLRVKDGAYINLKETTSGTKKYYNPFVETLEENATPTVYTWNEQANTIFADCNGTAAYLGNYGTNTTVGGSKTSYLIKDGALVAGQNALHFYLPADVA